MGKFYRTIIIIDLQCKYEYNEIIVSTIVNEIVINCGYSIGQWTIEHCHYSQKVYNLFDYYVECLIDPRSKKWSYTCQDIVSRNFVETVFAESDVFVY